MDFEETDLEETEETIAEIFRKAKDLTKMQTLQGSCLAERIATFRKKFKHDRKPSTKTLRKGLLQLLDLLEGVWVTTQMNRFFLEELLTILQGQKRKSDNEHPH